MLASNVATALRMSDQSHDFCADPRELFSELTAPNPKVFEDRAGLFDLRIGYIEDWHPCFIRFWQKSLKIGDLA